MNGFRQAQTLAVNDLRFMLRQRETLMWTFVMPIVFFFFIGSITGGFGGDGSSAKPWVVVDVPPDGGFLADHLLTRLERDYRVAVSDTVETPETWRRRITLPAAFTDSLIAGAEVAVAFRRNGTGLTSQYDQIQVQRATYTVLADLLVPVSRGEPITDASIQASVALPRALSLTVSSAGSGQEIPTGFGQAVPGTMVMFTLLIMLSSGAILVVIERQQGLLRRLAVSPMSRAAVLGGKWGARMGLGAIQIGFAMLVGTLLFKMNWGSQIPMLLVVLFVYAALAAVLGLLLGSVARSEGQAIALGVIASNVLAALGGCWWPIEVTPSWMQSLAIFLPTGIAMDALHKLVTFGDPATSVLPHVAVLAVGTVVVGTISARLFRFQ